MRIKQHKNKDNYFIIEETIVIMREHRKQVPEIDVLYQHTNRPVAVLGGGPSLPEDLKQVPKDAIMISCNHHAFKFVDPDYLCFLDDPHADYLAQDLIEMINKRSSYKRISFRMIEFTDYYVINQIPKSFENVRDTGRFATWVACYVTMGNVYLCGMGLRDPKEPEFIHSANPDEKEVPVGVRLKRWEEALSVCEKPDRIVFTSGPLKDHYDKIRNIRA